MSQALTVNIEHSTTNTFLCQALFAPICFFKQFVIIQHTKITVRIQDEVLALRTYYNSYVGADKARSASDRPATRDAQRPESGVLNSYYIS